jgi:hypothetical protein
VPEPVMVVLPFDAEMVPVVKFEISENFG